MALDPAPLSILFNASALALGTLKGPQRVTLDTLEVDCTLNESYDFEADVTEFEVEKGANVTDHRRLKPSRYSISGVISDTPLDRSLIESAIGAAGPALGLAVSATQGLTNLLAGDAIFTRDAFNKLQRLYEVGRETVKDAAGALVREDGTFTIVTKYRTYENMVVESLRVSRESGTGMVLPFTATFREIRFVDSATGQFTDSTLQGAKSLGHQGGDPASQKLIDDGKTALFRGADAGLNGSVDRADRFLKDKLLFKDLSNLSGKLGQ